jgi:hypothetical protein
MLQEARYLRLTFLGLDITFKFLIEGTGILATVVGFAEIHHAPLKIGEGNRVKRRLFYGLMDEKVLRFTNFVRGIVGRRYRNKNEIPTHLAI